MTLLGSFFRLNYSDRTFLIKTIFYSYYIRISLWTLPFSRVQNIAQRIGKHKVKPFRSIKNIIWAVNVTDPYVIGSTCLTRAITAQILLSQHDYDSTLKIGVIKDEKFEAHAWLEVDGRIIIGQTEKEFKSLINL